MARVSVIIPAYNEGSVVGDTISALKKLTYIDEIILVDDGSQDDTSAIARKMGAKVIKINHNSGKGNALNIGAKNAVGEVVALIGADLGSTADCAEKLIKPVMEGAADMTIAQITASKGSGGFGLVKGLAKYGVRHLTGVEMSSVLSGQRAMRRGVLQDVVPFAKGFGVEVDMTIKAIKKGYSIQEIPLDMKHRETGKDLRGFFHRGKQFKDILRVLVNLYMGGGQFCGGPL